MCASLGRTAAKVGLSKQEHLCRPASEGVDVKEGGCVSVEILIHREPPVRWRVLKNGGTLYKYKRDIIIDLLQTIGGGGRLRADRDSNSSLFVFSRICCCFKKWKVAKKTVIPEVFLEPIHSKKIYSGYYINCMN